MTFQLTSKRPRPVLKTGPGLTEQSHAESCDIHHIMRKYEKTGIIDHVNRVQGTYENYAGAPDFQEAQNIIAEAKSMFETVPATIRRAFDNDPGRFVSYMTDPANIEGIEKLGLDASHLKPDEDLINPATRPDPTPSESPASDDDGD